MRMETAQEAGFRSSTAFREVQRLAALGMQDSTSFALALRASNPDRQQIPTSVADRVAILAQRARTHTETSEPLAVVPVQPSPDDLFTVVAHVVFTGSAGA